PALHRQRMGGRPAAPPEPTPPRRPGALLDDPHGTGLAQLHGLRARGPPAIRAPAPRRPVRPYPPRHAAVADDGQPTGRLDRRPHAHRPAERRPPLAARISRTAGTGARMARPAARPVQATALLPLHLPPPGRRDLRQPAHRLGAAALLQGPALLFAGERR